MAKKPWVTPEEVRAYSEKESVKNRTDEQLIVDISRAESYVTTYTHNHFEAYAELPMPVKTAILILAEAYGWNGYVASQMYKSESFDDYSYSAGAEAIDIGNLDLAALLDEFVIAKPSGNVTMRLRRL